MQSHIVWPFEVLADALNTALHLVIVDSALNTAQHDEASHSISCKDLSVKSLERNNEAVGS